MTEARHIPKIIHQTWKDDHLPPDYARNQAGLQALHPDWQYRLWSDNDNRQFIADQYSWFLATYDSYAHTIERVDAVRYFILLSYGGVYLDLDMECLRPFDALFDRLGTPYFGMLALPTLEHSIIGNAFMAAPPGHPFFRYLTRRLSSIRGQDVTHRDVFNNTGPDMLARELAAFSQLCDYEVIGLDKVCDRGVLSQHPLFKHQDLDAIRWDKKLYLIHHHSNGWNVQHPAPSPVPPGYTLLLRQDIIEHDIDYVEYVSGDYNKIAFACNENPDAIGFNYNGFIKGAGGSIESIAAESNWAKESIEPWVCVKESWLARQR
ncbi:MAG: hypothetical protein HOC23_22420 [Halieaceae bacterium]|jgi:hypothetical protein|nr:hypothetical protein [Halieaceae bacterium]